MTINLSSLTDASSKLVAALEEDFQDRDAALGDVVIVVEVIHTDGKRGVRVRHSDDSATHVRLGLLQTAENIETTAAMLRWMRGAQRSAEDSPEDSPDQSA
jgi:hypothetical protein